MRTPWVFEWATGRTSNVNVAKPQPNAQGESEEEDSEEEDEEEEEADEQKAEGDVEVCWLSTTNRERLLRPP